jgi:hypothetical protein
VRDCDCGARQSNTIRAEIAEYQKNTKLSLRTFTSFESAWLDGTEFVPKAVIDPDKRRKSGKLPPAGRAKAIWNKISLFGVSLNLAPSMIAAFGRLSAADTCLRKRGRL